MIDFWIVCSSKEIIYGTVKTVRDLREILSVDICSIADFGYRVNTQIAGGENAL